MINTDMGKNVLLILEVILSPFNIHDGIKVTWP